MAIPAIPDVAAGIIIARFVGRIFGTEIGVWQYAFGVFMAILPDFDMLLEKFFRGVSTGAHKSALHYPLLMLVSIIPIALVQNKFYFFAGALCLLWHYLDDSWGKYTPGIAWLVPFSKRHYACKEGSNGHWSFGEVPPWDVKALEKITLDEWLEKDVLIHGPRVLLAFCMAIAAIIVIVAM